MIIIYKIFIYAACILQVQSEEISFDITPFHRRHNMKMSDVIQGLLQSLHGYSYEERITFENLNPQRLANEKTAPYGAGYLLSEVLDRYNNMANACPNAHLNVKTADDDDANNRHLVEVITRLDCIQRSYFDIHDLIALMHEIPKKFNYTVKVDQYEMSQLHSNMEAQRSKNELNLVGGMYWSAKNPGEVNEPYNMMEWLDDMTLNDYNLN